MGALLLWLLEGTGAVVVVGATDAGDEVEGDAVSGAGCVEVVEVVVVVVVSVEEVEGAVGGVEVVEVVVAGSCVVSDCDPILK